MAVFVQAGPAEILRAVQKDRLFCVTVEQRISDIIRAFAGNNAWLQHRNAVQILSQILYYSSTTLCGYQTLGEEYTSIVQVDQTLRHVPSFLRRALMIALESGGMTVIHNLLLKMQKEVNKNPNITNETKYKISVIFTSVKALLPFFQHLHHALFYWRGIYYDTVKRFLTVRYIKMQPWLQNHQSLYGFKILSIITALHLFIFGVRAIIRWKPNKPQEVIKCPTVVKEMNKCPLCLETRLETSATACGHLFCWNCILDWLQENNQCPLCREPITSSRIIPLSNFS